MVSQSCMEGFPKENNREHEKSVSVALDQKKIEIAMWGRHIDAIAQELIKIFAIVDHIKKQGVTNKEQVKEIAADLYSELDVDIFNYNIIFTQKVIDQISNANEVADITLSFNGYPIVVRKGSTIESVVQEWEEKGINSPEAIAQRNEAEAAVNQQVGQEQGKLNSMFKDLQSLDFSNTEAVIDWLYEYNTHYINGADTHDDAVKEIFKAKGHSTEKNDSIDFMLGEVLQDKQRMAEVIIGYMLANGGLFLRNDAVKNAIENWKKL